MKGEKTAVTEYRWATEADYRNIIEFANHAFRPDEYTGDFERDTSVHSYFPRILPKLYQNPGTAPMHYLAIQDGQIVGNVASFRLPTVVAGHVMNVIGIGTVSTHPEHRREGHMRRLMDDSMRHAEALQADYMVLGGQRQRYEHWGFENAGLDLRFEISRGNLRRLLGKREEAEYEFHVFTEEDRDLLAEERALRTSAGVYEERPEALECAALYSMGHVPIAVLKDGAFRASFLAGEKTVLDLRMKDAGEILPILADWMDVFARLAYERRQALGLPVPPELPPAIDSLTVSHVPPESQELIRILASSADECAVGPNEMIRILNYERTIRAYFDYKASFCPLADGALTLSFPNGEVLQLSVAEGRPSVRKLSGDDPAAEAACGTEGYIAFTELDAVNLLFGNAAFVTDYGYGLPGFARSWFPLPFYMPMSDEV